MNVVLSPLLSLVSARLVRSSLLLVALSGLAVAGRGSIIWDGDASKGTGVFKQMNLENGATCSVVTDASRGKVFRFHKPGGSNRAEAHGAKGYSPTEGQTVYIGWYSKLSSTVSNNAIFQWKSYPSHAANTLQNWPVVLKVISGKLTLIQRQPGDKITTLLSRTITSNTWYHHVIAIKVSRGTTGGFVQYWLNGQRQTFTTGSQTFNCRTLDADYVDPKWGIYGASSSTVDSYVGRLRIGTTYGDVAP